MSRRSLVVASVLTVVAAVSLGFVSLADAQAVGVAPTAAATRRDVAEHTLG